jgi:ornithine carbamoyltransferase
VKKDLLLITDFSRKEITELFNLAMELKTKTIPILEGKILAMLFQKPSTRTRVSFEVAMTQLGGHAVYLSPAEVGLGQREAVSDVARVLSRYTDGIMARVFEHEVVQELARYASVPVINGLSALSHPCQVLGDMLTVIEHKGKRESYRIAYVGDGNNVANSWINLAARYPISLRIGVPEGYEPSSDLLQSARAERLSDIDVFHDPREAVKNADVVYTDVWASMGQDRYSVIFASMRICCATRIMSASSCIAFRLTEARR